MLLRDYQQDLIDRTYKAFNDGYNSPCIVSPCGSGKTVIMCAFAKESERTLVIVHRKELKEQMEHTLKSYGVDMDTVQVEMIQTLTRRLSKTEKPTLILTDENHHSPAKSYLDVYEHFNDVRRIGFTATPIRLNGDGLIATNDCLIQGLTVQELIDRGNLAPFKYYGSPVLDSSKLKKQRGDFAVGEVEINLNEDAVSGKIIEHYKKLANETQAICYCPTVAYAEKISQKFNLHGISSAVISGKTPKDLREDIISKFRNGEIKIFCNVEIATEGFDIPDCETVILLRPTTSISLHVQQSMRSMRYKPNKTAIIIDHVENYIRHGLPNAEHEWKLEAKKRKKKNTVMITVCDYCCAVNEPTVKECIVCGAELKPVSLRLTEVEIVENDIELIELKDYSSLPKDFTKCKTILELYRFAMSKGYRGGWAVHRGEELGILFSCEAEVKAVRKLLGFSRGWDKYQAIKVKEV